MTLLIVDDEIITVKGILKGVDWVQLPFEDVSWALSAQEAKAVFEKQPVDMMLCDIEMKGDNGIELLEWVRGQGFDTECIFLTCHDEFKFAQQALRLQGMDYLLKPVPYDRLQKILSDGAVKIQEKKLDSTWKRYARDCVLKIKSNYQDDSDCAKNGAQIVRQVKAYINDHLSEEFGAEELARHVFVSTSWLYNVFRQEEHCTLNEYITDTRLFFAKELLKEPGMSVTKTAVSVGYSNYSYFTKVFKKKYGKTPSQYQHVCQKN